MKRGGKWFVALIILAVIAVVLTIVFINLFREKDTKQLAQSVHETVEKGYLNEENAQYKNIYSYLNNLETALSTVEEKNEVKNFKDSFSAYVVVGQFFDRQIVFSQYTETYKNNRKKIQKNFAKGQESANKLEQFILNNKEIVSGSDYWQANSWVNCKGDMRDLIVYTTNAFNLLADVYQASVDSKLMNNGLTDLVFDTFEKMSAQMIEKTSESNEFGVELNKLIGNYLTKNGEKTILNFNYSSNAMQKVADIKENGENSAYYGDFLQGRIEG